MQIGIWNNGVPGLPDGGWVMMDLRSMRPAEDKRNPADVIWLLERRVDALEKAKTGTPLPASTLTEDAIVAALKADPAMAGRAMMAFGCQTTGHDRDAFASAAYDFAAGFSKPGLSAARTLAGFLAAAASYRG